VKESCSLRVRLVERINMVVLLIVLYVTAQHNKRFMRFTVLLRS